MAPSPRLQTEWLALSALGGEGSKGEVVQFPTSSIPCRHRPDCRRRTAAEVHRIGASRIQPLKLVPIPIAVPLFLASLERQGIAEPE